ncbi:tyrosine-type recombinase/integrase [Paraburkholderia fungorum]|uniref:tyrosine-type recombinase/integrase n=1 Tax=Paraburkholderia fungorum TaxID=134537 RepID=UPI0004AA5489|nr:site-specific integrase [Paraburkholderia fungorum]KFX63370.1 integrase [Burkholderia sp. K24]USX08225.1 site-specific integrase [Paraburkholderia fungorum]
MASIRKRGSKWQARVCRAGYPPETKSFNIRADAERWARSVETEMDRGSFISRSEAEASTLEDIINRYITDVCPTQRSGPDAIIRLRATCRKSLAKLSMAALTPRSIAAYRDERLKEVKPATVIRELAFLSAIINHARREWDININNPVELIRKPPAPQGRDRILSADEETRLLAALVPTGRRNVWLLPATVLSLETGMRRGELVELRWSNVNLEAQTAHLPMTKNGTARTVPLSTKAVGVLAALPRSIDGRVIPVKGITLHAAFRKACKRAGIADFHWHDLRHTAITRLAQKLPNVIELAAVSGHRSLAMLKRYYHPSATELARKLG